MSRKNAPSWTSVTYDAGGVGAVVLEHSAATIDQASAAAARLGLSSNVTAEMTLFHGLRPRLSEISCLITGSSGYTDLVIDTVLSKWQLADQKSISDPECWLIETCIEASIDIVRKGQLGDTQVLDAPLPEYDRPGPAATSPRKQWRPLAGSRTWRAVYWKVRSIAGTVGSAGVVKGLLVCGTALCAGVVLQTPRMDEPFWKSSEANPAYLAEDIISHDNY